MTRSATPAVTPDGLIPGSALDRRAGGDLAVRFAPTSYNQAARTIQAVASSGARVRRWGIHEELAISAEAIDLARVTLGQVRLLDSHDQGSIEGILGVVARAWIESGQLMVEIRFADSEAGRRAEAMVLSGDVAGLSVGYRVLTWTLSQVENDTEVWRADRWELLEVSLVAVPADPAALIRSAAPQPEPSQMETDDMRRNVPSADAPAPQPVTTPAAPALETRAAPAPSAAPQAAPAAQSDTAAILRAERDRSAAILDIATRAGMTAEASRAAVASDVTVEAFRAQAFDTLVSRQTPSSHVRVEQDETETRRAAMQEALTIRLAPAAATPATPSEAARGFMDHSLIDLAAERLGERRVPGSFGAREDMLRRAFHTTSDFPILFENVLNQSLAPRYALAQPTFRMIARQRTYNDFRPHNSVRAGDFPDLQPVNPEGGEIKAGTFGESKESTRVLAYGVQVLLSRAMLVNDNLNAIAQVLNDRGNAVARFEDRTFYAMAFGGSGSNGPTLLETTRQLFNTTDATLAAANAAITVASLSLGRAALRKRKSKDGVELNLPATILLVGPDKETEAQQILAPVQAQQAGNVNPFSGALSLVVTEKITGNAWHMFAAPSDAPVFEWGLLDGYTAPRMRMEDPFGAQGTKMSLEHDFGCGAIDFRGAYKNAGA